MGPAQRFGVSVIYFLLPILTFIITSLPGVGRLTPFAALALVVAGVGLRLLPLMLPRVVVVTVWIGAVVTLVGSSGWFFSPFFFMLYLAAIALGFIYRPTVAVSFTLGLLLIFASSIGEVSATHDFLTLLSLLSVIPITIILRRTFLLVQQEHRGILILETDERHKATTALDAVLTNQVNKVAIILRQPITYIRQALALLKENAISADEYPEVLHLMSRSADEVFTLIKEFESGTTKNTLITRTDTRHDKK
jgi:signal transduction histidine kinase